MLANKFRLMGSSIALLALTFAAASCDGFFVDPTLTSVSVGPQNLSLTVNEQWQMTATGTYSDGSQKTLSNATWSSSDPTMLSVDQTSGKVTGQSVGSATVSASAGSCSSCSGSTSVIVTVQGISSITVSPTSQTVLIGGSPVFYKALTSGTTDITNAGASWSVLDATGLDQTSNFTVGYQSGKGEGFLPSSSVIPGTYTVRAARGSVTGTATMRVQ